MKKFLIIGMGEFGTQIATHLIELGNDVCLVDASIEKANAYKDIFDNVFRGDCLQLQTLKELDVKDYDSCIVTVGDNFQNSLEITSRLKEAGAKHVVAKSYSDIQSKFLAMAGADEVAFPEKESALKLATTLSDTRLVDFIRISEDLGLYNKRVPKAWVKKSIVDLDIRKAYRINILAVKKNNDVFIPDPDYVFEESDLVYLFGSEKTIRRLK